MHPTILAFLSGLSSPALLLSAMIPGISVKQEIHKQYNAVLPSMHETFCEWLLIKYSSNYVENKEVWIQNKDLLPLIIEEVSRL